MPLVWVVAIVVLAITRYPVTHLKIAKQNGITKEEIAEEITHLAFYVGWLNAWSAFNIAKKVWD